MRYDMKKTVKIMALCLVAAGFTGCSMEDYCEDPGMFSLYESMPY